MKMAKNSRNPKISFLVKPPWTKLFWVPRRSWLKKKMHISGTKTNWKKSKNFRGKIPYLHILPHRAAQNDFSSTPMYQRTLLELVIRVDWTTWHVPTPKQPSHFFSLFSQIVCLKDWNYCIVALLLCYFAVLFPIKVFGVFIWWLIYWKHFSRALAQQSIVKLNQIESKCIKLCQIELNLIKLRHIESNYVKFN